jgi:hypothetical protein
MGKKSLIKSTAKKRPPKKTAPAEQTDTTPPVKKNAPVEQPSTQSKPARKPAAAPIPTVVSMRDILKRQYTAEIPKTRYTSPAGVIEKPALASSDPYAGMDATAVDRIKQLLSNTYSEAELKAAAEKAAAEKAAAEKACRKGRRRKGRCRKGRCRKGRCRKGRCRKGRRRKGRCRKGRCRKGRCRKGRCRKGRCRKGRCRKGCCRKGRCRKTRRAGHLRPATGPDGRRQAIRPG